MYILLDENRKPCDMQKKYDINKIFKCYDTLHSLSATVAIDEIRKQFVYC